ncbi:hypothetical protein RND81_11G151000 [Saponaria officinalis]
MAQSSDTSSTDTSGQLVKTEYNDIAEKRKVPVRSVSLNLESVVEQRPGWPLLRRSSFPTQKGLDSKKTSVVQWVLGCPGRKPSDTPQSSCCDSCSSKSECPLGEDNSDRSLDKQVMSFDSRISAFNWFSYDVLCHATSQFSSGNLIGQGGCSRVYKGTFLDGRQVAVKVIKSSKQALTDFYLEADIVSSLRHQNITPLLGACIDSSELICVYDFMSRGSLEDNLHAKNREKCEMSWDARYSVAVGIAEALEYLHTGCSRPVIHRDVKSSNILLSDNFEPQLSDFGLAIWEPNSPTSSETCTKVAGTFGYLAPEYFMYGKVTHKVDVYSFGVVLLELLSGKKPINYCKGQESLVMWAKPILESGKVSAILDPKLEGNFNESQMQRMALAATFCLTRAARFRPNMGQILKLLKGEETMESWANAHVHETEGEDDFDADDNDDDEVYRNSSTKKSI